MAVLETVFIIMIIGTMFIAAIAETASRSGEKDFGSDRYRKNGPGGR